MVRKMSVQVNITLKFTKPALRAGFWFDKFSVYFEFSAKPLRIRKLKGSNPLWSNC